LPELEKLGFLPKEIHGSNDSLLVLFFSDITAHCGRAKVMRDLVNNCSKKIKVALVLDSSYRPQDIEKCKKDRRLPMRNVYPI
jgi:hypothetical protein